MGYSQGFAGFVGFVWHFEVDTIEVQRLEDRGNDFLSGQLGKAWTPMAEFLAGPPKQRRLSVASCPKCGARGATIDPDDENDIYCAICGRW